MGTPTAQELAAIRDRAIRAGFKPDRGDVMATWRRHHSPARGKPASASKAPGPRMTIQPINAPTPPIGSGRVKSAVRGKPAYPKAPAAARGKPASAPNSAPKPPVPAHGKTGVKK